MAVGDVRRRPQDEAGGGATATPPPAMYNPPAESQRESVSIGTITLALRVPQFLFTLIALALLSSMALVVMNYGGDQFCARTASAIAMSFFAFAALAAAAALYPVRLLRLIKR